MYGPCSVGHGVGQHAYRIYLTRCHQTPYGATDSGEGGIRTPKPVRAPVFETGALPFCHLSRCGLVQLLNGRGGIRTHEAGLLPTRSPGVRLSPLGHPSQKKTPPGVPEVLLQAEGVGLGRYAPRARSLRSLGSNPRDSLESRLERSCARHLSLLPGGGGVRLPATPVPSMLISWCVVNRSPKERYISSFVP